ncbi:MAG: hypothetical protein NZ765_12950 [Anaerolineae bacterium]|nr:hypothetical protein [Anaerolineae bacterium]MDW8072356.1 hypothetical protein [Anaerolineae bacterium]
MFAPLTLDDPFTLFIVTLASILIIGYLIGRAVNRGRARAISAWLEPGMRTLGGTPLVQAVNRTAFRVKVLQARAPFSVVTASVVLLSREVWPIWLWERLHRNSDVVFFHFTLRHSPRIGLEIVDPTRELGRRGKAQAERLQWPLAARRGTYHLYCPDGHLSAQHMEELLNHVVTARYTPHRVAVRAHAPHVLVSFAFSEIQSGSSTELLRWMNRLVRLLPLNEAGKDA